MENFSPYKPQSWHLPIRERKIYDVFLSFRGTDVRKTLVDHLHRSLSSAGLNVFIDSEKLEKGENIGKSLQQAIQNSTIYIPIFSPDYASSVWCLREVSLMWEIKSSTSSHIMIPLFYNVEPSHVRHVGGPYAEAFNKHQTQDRNQFYVIQGWRDVLRKVSSLSGWSLQETSAGYEGKLVDQVVKDVLQSLDFGMRAVAEHPVGLIPRSEEVIQLLKLGDDTISSLTFGIWGMPGLGITNLSKSLHNEIRHLFEASSFVSNIKREDSLHGLIKLQQQILKDLLKTKIKMNDIDHGKILMRNRLASLKALVILDDVDNERQLDALMGDWFGKGTRIIITTQNKRVLEVRQVDVIYPMRGLELAEAVDLFSWHAFRREQPERGYENMTERIVKICSGLPLSLEIIGTDLYNRDKTRYIEAVDDDADEEEHTGEYFCEFSMHEQIRDMGRRIVREESWNDPTNRSRVWLKEDICTLMQAPTTILENSNIEGLMWRRRMELQHIHSLAPLQKLGFLLWWDLQVKTQIERLPTNLKYLVLSDCHLNDNNAQMAGIECGSDHNGSSLLSPVLPESIAQPKSLRYIDMSGTKQTFLPNEICELHCLEELYLSRCSLEALPETFGNLIRLKFLDVSNNFLSEFPSSFRRLVSLVNLEMAQNEQLVVFPTLPENLTALNARGCSKLQSISVENDMKRLKTMDLSHCKSLTALSTLLGCTSLRYLRLDGCKELDKLDPLPECLVSLSVSGCTKLQNVFFNVVRIILSRGIGSISTLSFDGALSRPLPPPASLPPPPLHPVFPVHPPEIEELCMIGCDNIRLHIYQLLRDFHRLKRLDLSVSSEMVGESQPLVGQKNLTLQSGILCVAAFFFFVVEREENVRLPQMDVLMTVFNEINGSLHSKTFEVPPRRKGDDSRRSIIRICIWDHIRNAPQRTASCSYSVQDRLSQQGDPVFLRHVEFLPLKGAALCENVIHFLQSWGLLSASNDVQLKECGK
ncbi:disease resistance protein Roq1 isoform X3 [Cryptomeria japonica]|uniref:disease resistance protein Roq1 isoform X3 n=1 Tax=Cryptomeria japonica TaxID=3369 RepID=UPI0027DA6B43|nr:disease resistance protein Roq1 isoform X3 [Cryptomeria japonica]